MMMRQILRLFFAVAVCNATLAVGETYYVSKSGNDANSGRSWQDAWSSIEKVNSSISAGDMVLFGTGTWYDSQIRPPQGGDINHQTVYACSTFDASSKHKARIYGAEIVTGWTQYSGSIYRKRWTGTDCYEYGCGSLVQDEVPLQLIDLGYTTMGPGRYYYSNDYIYAWCFNDENPNDHEMLASCKPPVFLASCDPDIAYVRFWGLDLRYGQQATVFFNARTNHVSIEHCNIGSAGHTSANAAGVFASANECGKVATDSSTFGRYNMVRSCTIGNIRSLLCSWGHLGTGDGIILYSEKHFTVDSNYFYYPIGTGINFKAKEVGTAMGCCVAKYNTIVDAGRHGVDIWKHPHMDSIYGNVIISPATHGIFIHTSSLPWPGDIVLFNNTIYSPGDRGIEIWEDAEIGHCGEGVEIKYNVIASAFVGASFSYWSSGACQNACVIDNNLYFNISRGNECSGGHTWSAWQNCGFDLNGSYDVNPGFNDAQNGDFSRPGASTEMSRGDYGDRHWSLWGAIQPAGSCDLPGAPALASPYDGAVNVGWPVYFDWSDVAGSIRYQIQIHTNPDFIGPVVDFQPTQSGYSTSSLYPETLHYWRVRVLNDCGWGAWSVTRQFITSGLAVDADDDTARADVSSNPHLYPDPFYPNDVPFATFTGAPPGSAVLFVTSTGNRVRRWDSLPGGEIKWDGTNEYGREVASGVYLWYIEGTDLSGKFTVIR